MRVVQDLKDMEEFQAVLEGFVLKYLWNEMYSNYVTWMETSLGHIKTRSRMMTATTVFSRHNDAYLRAITS